MSGLLDPNNLTSEEFLAIFSTDRHAAAPVAAPTDFGNQGFWHKSTDGVTLVNGHVSDWSDQFSGGFDLSYPVAAQRPFYSPQGAPGGLPSVLFDATDDILVRGTTIFNGLTKFSYFGALKNNSNSTDTFLMDSDSDNLGIQISNGILVIRFGGSNVGYTGANDLTSTYVVNVIYDGTQSTNATKLKVWINGVAQTLGFTGTIPSSIASNMTYVIFGAYTGGGYGYDGKIHEHAFYTDAFNDTDRSALNGYFTQKYVGKGEGGYSEMPAIGDLTTNGSVVLDGDSIAQAVGAGIDIAQNFNVVASNLGWTGFSYRNVGVAGTQWASHTAAIYANVISSCGSGENIVIAHCGTNDVVDGQFTARQAADAAWLYADTLLTAALAEGVRIRLIINTVLPRGNGGAGFEARRQAYNALLLAEAASHNVTIADVASDERMGGAGQNVDPYYQDESGAWVHPTFIGQCVLFAHDMRAARSIFGISYQPCFAPMLQGFLDFRTSTGMEKVGGGSVANGDLVYSVPIHQGFQSASGPASSASGQEFTWVSNAGNGHGAIRAASGNKQLYLPTYSRLGLTRIVVGRWDNVNPGIVAHQGAFDYLQNTNNYWGYVGDGSFTIDSAKDASGSPGPQDDQFHTLRHEFAGTHASHKIYIDDVSQSLVTADGRNHDQGVGQIDAATYLGHGTIGASGYYVMDFFYGMYLSTQEKSEIATYIASALA